MHKTARLLAAFLMASAAFCQSILVDGGNGKTLTLTVADLQALPQQKFKATEHETTGEFDGVLLGDVLAKVDTPSREKLRGKELASYLLVEALDGYRAVFVLPEFDPGFTDRKLYLVWKRDGKPLSDKEGPFRIVVPDEKRPARWVRQVKSLRLMSAAPSTSAPPQ